MLKSLLNIFQKTKAENNEDKFNDELTIFASILFEASVVDGKIDHSEIDIIRNSLKNITKNNHEKIDEILNQCIKNAGQPNKLYRLTSKINKEFEYEKKIKLFEVLWEVILADGKIHDFESSLIRRLAGLLYISDVDCGNAKKRIINKDNIA